MKYFLTIAALLLGTCHPARTYAQSLDLNGSSTRAVVVGISDYQDAAIPDLQFADRDAEAFAEWLRSPAGGGVPAGNIVLLTNEKATNARLSASLDWLIEVCGEGDRVVIYFSGHGDVETKTRGQFGFLLAWDSPPTNYKAGAYSIIYLQDIISTLSMDKMAHVTVVTDACHAGKLAGSSVGGTQATAQALSQQFANEVKIMSCQPNEFSLEGQQWGNGRGVFSYHLLDGLTGLADQNADGAIALREIDRYLEDKVSNETAPHSQTPMTVGDRNTVLAQVDAAALADILKRKKGEPQFIAGTGSKGLADGFLAAADSATQVLYQNFEAALAAGNLLDGDSSADFFYKKLLENEAMKPLHGLMRRNLAVALQDEVQQALNALLADDPYETNHFIYNPSKYTEYPRYLHRTIELLGEKHYMYPTLRAKELYFESYNLTQTLGAANVTLAFQDSIRPIAQQKLHEAIALDSTSGYLEYAYALTFYYDGNPATFDSVIHRLKLATERSPHWLLPCLELTYEPGMSEFWINRALSIKPDSYVAQERLSWLYQWEDRTEESLVLSDKMIREKPDIFNAYTNAGATCMMQKEYERAEKYLVKSLALEPSPNNDASEYFIELLVKTRRQQQARALADSLFNHPSASVVSKVSFIRHLIKGLIYNEQYELAAELAEKALKIETDSWLPAESHIALGIYQIREGNYSEGRALLQKAIEAISDHLPFRVRQIHYEGTIAEMQGDAMRADSLFQEGLRVDLSKNHALRIRLSGVHESLRLNYGRFLLRQKRYPEATGQFQKLLEEEPNSWRGYLGMALIHAEKGDNNESLDWLEKSLNHWLPTPELVAGEPLFSETRKTERFMEMMEKNFPTGWEKRLLQDTPEVRFRTFKKNR